LNSLEGNFFVFIKEKKNAFDIILGFCLSNEAIYQSFWLKNQQNVWTDVSNDK
jgi:hypothetical protein